MTSELYFFLNAKLVTQLVSWFSLVDLDLLCMWISVCKAVEMFCFLGSDTLHKCLWGISSK